MPLGETFPNILQAARLGAEWAWAALYRELAPSVLGYLRACGAADPQDLSAEVFLRVVRDLARFEGDEGNFRSWVFVIAHHRLIDERRRLMRRPEAPYPVDAMESSGPAGNTEEEAMQHLATKHVREIINGLVPDQRDVLLLRVIGGLTVQEVARVVGKSNGAVKALQRRGLAAISRRRSREGALSPVAAWMASSSRTDPHGAHSPTIGLAGDRFSSSG